MFIRAHPMIWMVNRNSCGQQREEECECYKSDTRIPFVYVSELTFANDSYNGLEKYECHQQSSEI